MKKEIFKKNTAIRWGILFAWFLGLFGFQNFAFINSAVPSCPVFHCNPEATTVINQGLVTSVTGSFSNNSYGSLKAQGCSGDGSNLACIFFTDNLTGNFKGSVKLVNAKTLDPIWGSAGALSKDLDVDGIFAGQVPSFLPDGTIGVGDQNVLVKLSLSGQLVSSLSLTLSLAKNMGLTPIADDLAVLSQADGTLSLIDLVNWKVLSSLTLLDNVQGLPLKLVSPSSGSTGALYAVGKNSNDLGFLFSVHLDDSRTQLQIFSQFTFDGSTGASPVIIKPSQSGLASNLILLNAPGLNGDKQNYLLGLVDSSKTLAIQWKIALKGTVGVSPTIDEKAKVLYLLLFRDPNIYSYTFLDGLVSQKPINVATLANLPSSFKVNGHMAAAQTDSSFSLLIAGSVTSGDTVGEYVFAINPKKASKLLWSQKISTVPLSSMAAWNVSASSGSQSSKGGFCPLVASPDLALTRICNGY